MRRNWSGILAAMPDLEIENEDSWRTARPCGEIVKGAIGLMGPSRSCVAMIFQVADGLIVATFYLAPVVHDGRDADAAVRRSSHPRDHDPRHRGEAGPSGEWSSRTSRLDFRACWRARRQARPR